jgi:hypothetical protein
MNNLPGLASNCDPPFSVSQVARITGVSHWRPAKYLLYTPSTEHYKGVS